MGSCEKELQSWLGSQHRSSQGSGQERAREEENGRFFVARTGSCPISSVNWEDPALNDKSVRKA